MKAKNLITLILIVLLAGCSSSPAADPSLKGTRWTLVALNGKTLIENSQITLNFAETSLNGSAGCNTYGGNYTASKDGLQLSDVYVTEMACMEPAGIMSQEKAYLDALNAAARYRVEGNQLEVYNKAGAQILAFTAVGGQSSQATP